MLLGSAAWWPDDRRLHLLRSTANNAGAARNLGRTFATGELVAYLDDDCRYFPWWIHAAVATFEEHPTIDCVHGMRLIDGAGSPWMYTEALDPVVLHDINPVDSNTLVHRRNVDFVWPEDRSSCSDYLAVVQTSHLSWHHATVPAVAYSESSPNRV